MKKEEAAEEIKEDAKTQKNPANKHEPGESAPLTVEELVLNTPLNKYDAVLFGRRWAYHLKSKDENALSVQELISQSLKDVLSGQVKYKTVRDLPPVVQMLKKQKGLSTAILDNIGKSAPADSAEIPAGKNKDSQDGSGKKDKD